MTTELIEEINKLLAILDKYKVTNKDRKELRRIVERIGKLRK